jgi:dihydrofolate synthase/folylpolyglutamate synthase
MAQVLFPMFDLVVLTEVPSPRTACLHEMQTAAEVTGARVLTADGTRAALAQAIAATPADGLVVVTGSVYLVGELRELLTERRV